MELIPDKHPEFYIGQKVRLGAVNAKRHPFPPEYEWLRRGRVVTIVDMMARGVQRTKRGVKEHSAVWVYTFKTVHRKPVVWLEGVYLRELEQRDRKMGGGRKRKNGEV